MITFLNGITRRVSPITSSQPLRDHVFKRARNHQYRFGHASWLRANIARCEFLVQQLGGTPVG